MSQRSKRRQPREGKRAIIYTRQSTYREESISLELQEETCRAFANREGYQVIKTISDPGISGLEFDKRPGIREAIDLIQRSEADVIIVWQYSRVSRDTFDQAFIDREVERGGGRIKSATEGNEWEAKQFGHLAAAWDSKQKAKNWKAVKARRIGQNLHAGGAPPLGYAHGGKGQAFVPDPVYGPVVREMYEMYLRGIGPAGIATALNKRGLMTPKHSENYGGKPFGVPTIARALDSGFAAGYIRRDEDRLPGAHEPLIDDAMWQAYLRERERRRQENPNPKSRQPKWFLGAGLTVCGRCRGNMVVDSYRSSKSQALCSTYRSTAPGKCKGAWVDRVKLEALVTTWLWKHVDEVARAAEETTGTVDDDRAELAKAIDRERAEEAKLRDGLRRAARLVATGDMTDEDYADAKREADTRLTEVTGRLAELQAELDALDPAGDAYQRLIRALGRMGTKTQVDTRPLDVAFVIPPDAVVDTTDWPTEQEWAASRGVPAPTTEAVAPEEWHALLRRIIKRVIVNKRTVVIEPRVGDATTIDRAAEMPPRKRTDVQARDRKTGKFVKARRSR